MTTAAHVCLNMIVRNEAARIERCLLSLRDHIDSYVIVDTGSTDLTPSIIRQVLHDKPGKVLTGAPFVNFEQARNLALLTGRVWLTAERFNDVQLVGKLPPCYFLLVDADMELRVDDPQWREKLTGADAYDVVQRAGSLSYHNTRLLRHDAPAKYVGVTHEYIDGARSQKLNGVWFLDHADGSNRKNKFERDIKLLEDGLKADPDNGRYLYYLAQSYKDAGMPGLASEVYKRRVETGGWDEEVWHAQLQAARCLKESNDERWIAEMLLACDMRPSRAEPFYELAKYYREKGKNNLAVMFAEQPVGYPGDLLFVEDFVYDTGLREEYSIAAFYDKRTRESGFAACNWLTLDPKTPEHSRELARNNLFHYMPKLTNYVSSFRARRIPWVPYDGWVACNPSVVAGVSGLLVNVRAVNYRIREDGSYDMQGDSAIRTRNCLVWLDHGLDFIREQEVIWNRPEPAYKDVIGLEDIRLFEWGRGMYYFSACVRELSPEGWPEQVWGGIDENDGDVTFWELITPEGPKQCEKNWMPEPRDGCPEWRYRLDRRIDSEGKFEHLPVSEIKVDHISGGTQLIPFKGGKLAIVHEARIYPGTSRRYYMHRFVKFGKDGTVQQISRPFVFNDKQIEFAAGLAWSPADDDTLVVTYGVRDCEAWIGTMSAMEVDAFLWKPMRHF